MEGQKQHFAAQAATQQPVEDDDSGYVTRRFIIDPSRSAAPIMLPDPPPQSPTPPPPPITPSHHSAQIPQEQRTPLLDPFAPVQAPTSPPTVQALAVMPQALRPVPTHAQQLHRPYQQLHPTQYAAAQVANRHQVAMQQPPPQAQAQTVMPAQYQGHATVFPPAGALAPASRMGLQSHQHILNIQRQVNQAPAQAQQQQQPVAAPVPPQAHASQTPQAQAAAPALPTPAQVAQTPLQQPQQPAPQAPPPTPPQAAPAPQHTSSFAPVAPPAPQHTSSFAPVAAPAPQHTSSFAPVAPPAPQHTSSFAPVAPQQAQHTSSFAPVTPAPQTHALAVIPPPMAGLQQPYSQHFLHSVQALPQNQEGTQQIQHIPQPQLQLAVTAYSRYKLPVIPGVAPRATLPPGVGLVLEGGGTRGFYSAGVFEAFMDAGLMFPYIAAVSAGAANVLSYVSGQRGRNRLIIERLVSDPRYLSTSNLIKERSLFDFDFIFKTIPEEYLYWDQQMFDRVQTRLLTGAIDCREGRTVWFEKSQLEPDFMPTIASCSIPLMSKIVRFDNRDLLDGGILDPIPIEKSIADGNNFHVVVLTQNADYIKQPTKIAALLKMTYRKYPHLIWAIKERHEAYNRQVALAERLEREGRALIIRPHNTVEVSRIESDPDKLLELHDEGHLDGALAVDKLHQIFRF